MKTWLYLPGWCWVLIFFHTHTHTHMPLSLTLHYDHRMLVFVVTATPEPTTIKWWASARRHFYRLHQNFESWFVSSQWQEFTPHPKSVCHEFLPIWKIKIISVLYGDIADMVDITLKKSCRNQNSINYVKFTFCSCFNIAKKCVYLYLYIKRCQI